MNYHRLALSPSLSAGYLSQTSASKYVPAMLKMGRVLPPATVRQPCTFSVEADPETTFVPSDWYANVSLMSTRMVKAMQAAGVDNLQTWPATILSPEGQAHDQYHVVNIVGLVSCAKPEGSEALPIADKRFFLRLAIDPTKASGLKVFRLAESPIEVLVDDGVAQALKALALRDVALEQVS